MAVYITLGHQLTPHFFSSSESLYRCVVFYGFLLEIGTTTSLLAFARLWHCTQPSIASRVKLPSSWAHFQVASRTYLIVTVGSKLSRSPSLQLFWSCDSKVEVVLPIAFSGLDDIETDQRALDVVDCNFVVACEELVVDGKNAVCLHDVEVRLDTLVVVQGSIVVIKDSITTISRSTVAVGTGVSLTPTR
jgi:hypothetical protein